MMNIQKHMPGSFCCVELGTSDPAGAKKFYQSLFGWGLNKALADRSKEIDCAQFNELLLLANQGSSSAPVFLSLLL